MSLKTHTFRGLDPREQGLLQKPLHGLSARRRANITEGCSSQHISSRITQPNLHRDLLLFFGIAIFKFQTNGKHLGGHHRPAESDCLNPTFCPGLQLKLDGLYLKSFSELLVEAMVKGSSLFLYRTDGSRVFPSIAPTLV
jgi:hypothetical protein